jgi:hypothetical protein
VLRVGGALTVWVVAVVDDGIGRGGGVVDGGVGRPGGMDDGRPQGARGGGVADGGAVSE